MSPSPLYVAIVTNGLAPTLVAAVTMLAREMEATGVRVPLHIWIGWQAVLPANVREACAAAADAHGVAVAWRETTALLGESDVLTRTLRDALGAATAARWSRRVTYVGATRLLMKRDALGQALVSLDDDIVGAVMMRSRAAPAYRRILTSREVLGAAPVQDAALMPTEAGTLLRLLNPHTLPSGYSAGPHVLQPGLAGDSGADAPLAELEYGLPLSNGAAARRVQQIVTQATIGPMDRLMTYAWAVSPEASGIFFPPAFRNAEYVWYTLERARRPSLRLMHLPVGCLHQPADRRVHEREYSLTTAVLQWRTNDWLSDVFGDIAGEHGTPDAAIQALADTSDEAWRDLIERAIGLRRRVLSHRVSRCDAAVDLGFIAPGLAARIRRCAAEAYRSRQCWIPEEWRQETDTDAFRRYVQATARLAAACAQHEEQTTAEPRVHAHATGVLGHGRA